MRNYISKINDRNLQRKRESGLTTYALISIFFILLYKILEQYPSGPLRSNFWEVISLLTYTFNICLPIYTIYSFYELTIGNVSSLRIIPKSSENDSLLENVINMLILLVPLSANIIMLVHESFYIKNFNWYYCTTSIILFLFFILVIYLYFPKRNINQAYEVFEGTGKVDSDKDFSTLFIYSLCFIYIIITIISFESQYFTIGKLNVILFASLIYLVPLIMIKIAELRRKDKLTTALENLEYEIYIKDLSDAEIVERLQKHYMGFLLSEWIVYNLKELESFKKEIDEDREEIKTKKEELLLLDEIKYPIEHRGRNNQLNILSVQFSTKIKVFFENKLNEIESIWDESQLTSKERGELSQLYNKVKNEYSNSILE